ncbi:MAG: type II toxin-antitoxin system RelE/ParE family toxin [Coriobacteriia bacterium]|nr:type II toxin-antitoxin system RelE/ParE family toxin [Coriobacteriia bacterium]
MSLPVHIHEAAEAEIEEAVDVYDVESAGLGDVFTTEIQHAIERISRHPHAAPIARGSLRAKTLTKFPYSLVYFIGQNEITLLAVAHQSRRPFYWTSRL